MYIVATRTAARVLHRGQIHEGKQKAYILEIPAQENCCTQKGADEHKHVPRARRAFWAGPIQLNRPPLPMPKLLQNLSAG